MSYLFAMVVTKQILQEIEKINKALEREETLIIGADCEITYSGRAETKLAQGDRVIMIKSDKTLLVHQPHGSNPINYMKENSSHRIIVEDEMVFLKSKNVPLNEFVDVLINKIHFVNSAKLSDGTKIELTGNEKDMADMIAKNPAMVEKGLRLVKQEEQTEYGFIDVLCHDTNKNLVVIECKRYKADFKAVEQLKRYVEKIKKSKGIETVRGILAAPTISDNAKTMMEDNGFSFCAVEPPRYKERFRKGQKKLGEF